MSTEQNQTDDAAQSDDQFVRALNKIFSASGPKANFLPIPESTIQDAMAFYSETRERTLELLATVRSMDFLKAKVFGA